jgi:hypothetical protein
MKNMSLGAIAAVQVPLIIFSIGSVVFLGRQIRPLLAQREQLQGDLVELRNAITASQGRLETVKAEVDRLEAERAQLESANETLQADKGVLSRSIVDLDSGGRAQQVVEAAVAAVDNPEKISPRMYVHVATEEHYEVARALPDLLQRAGFIVPSIERVAAVPTVPQLRYFRGEDADLARKATDIVRELVPQVEARLFDGPSGRTRPRHLELWF